MSKPPLLPFFLDVQGLTVVVTGEGRAAARAARLAAEAGATVRRAEAGLEPAHLEGAAIVLAASGNADVDGKTTCMAAGKGLLALTITGSKARARLGALAMRDDIAFAACTQGAAPECAPMLAQHAAESITAAQVRFTKICAELRDKLAERFPDPERLDVIWQQILDSPVLGMLEAGLDDEAQELAERMAWGTG